MSDFFLKRIIIGLLSVFFSAWHFVSAQPSAEQQPNRSFLIAADAAGLPGYTGAASIDADLLLGSWFGIRAGIGTCYAAFNGTAKGYSFAAKILSPPRHDLDARLEINIGASSMKVKPEENKAEEHLLLPLFSIGAYTELTNKYAPIAVFGRAGIGLFYYYGVPFYIGFGAAF